MGVHSHESNKLTKTVKILARIKCPSHGLHLLLPGHGNCMLFSSRAWSEGESLKHFPSLMFFSPCHGLDMLEGPRIFRSTCIFCCPSFDSHIPSFNMKLPTLEPLVSCMQHSALVRNFEIPTSLVTVLGPFPNWPNFKDCKLKSVQSRIYGIPQNIHI